jgi:hypothetical protein
MTSPNKFLYEIYNIDQIHLQIPHKSIIIFTCYHNMHISSSVSSVSFDLYWSHDAQTDQHVKQQIFTALTIYSQLFYICNKLDTQNAEPHINISALMQPPYAGGT